MRARKGKVWCRPRRSSQAVSNVSGFGRVNIANTIAVVRGKPGEGFLELELSDGTNSWLNEIKVERSHTTLK